MASIISILVCVTLAFLYRILYNLFVKLDENTFIRKNYNYIWAFLVLVIALIYPDSLLRKGTLEFLHSGKALKEIMKITVCGSILGCLSGYKTHDRKQDFDFCIIFPVFEEILFRGVIFLILLNTTMLNEQLAVLLSAFLFGVMHFQYFGFKKDAVRFVILAFIGGYFFAYIALITNSLIPLIFLHIVFNTSAILFSKYMGNCRFYSFRHKDK